jgi:ABC-type Fe3+ transport system permease subunit
MNALSRLAILVFAIALSFSTAPAMGCGLGKRHFNQTSWLRMPLVLILAVPGTLLASSLYFSGRYYDRQR